jgi:uncharacterized tellurite resistance protein B-like protein
MVIHKSFADFVLFLYVHMAHADGEFHLSEKEVILEKIPKLFPGESSPAKKLEIATNEYVKVSPDEITKIIRDTFKHFSEVKFNQKYKVYTDMYDIIHADGKVDESETYVLNELKEIIEMGSLKNKN